jgi:hypothetical protein
LSSVDEFVGSDVLRFSPTCPGGTLSILLAAPFGCPDAAELELRLEEAVGRLLAGAGASGLRGANAEGRADGAGAEGRAGGAVAGLGGGMLSTDFSMWQDRRTCSETSCPGVMAYCIMLVPTAAMAPSFARARTALITSWLVAWEVVELMIVFMLRPSGPDRWMWTMIAVRRSVALRGSEVLLTTGARLGRRVGIRVAEGSDAQADLEP